MNKIICGDVIQLLQTLDSESVQCVVTSPPYWGLRDYGMPGQIGLEEAPEEFVAKMVEVFQEVKRVLRNDGTLWLNLGDSYVGGGRGGADHAGDKQRTNVGTLNISPTGRVEGLKPKDLCGIPWRVALALQADGWYLRSDIIWHKPNPMPESVTDRPTKSHEYLFLLSKSQSYFYDAEAIKEDAVTDEDRPNGVERDRVYGYNSKQKQIKRPGKNSRENQNRDPNHSEERKVRSPAGWKTGPGSHGSIHADGREKETSWATISPEKRNKRTVWTIATSPYRDAHFATFPEALVIPCILAGSPEGGVIMDPFSGAGTTCMVAKKLGRRYIGIELNSKYVDMSERRIETECGTLI